MGKYKEALEDMVWQFGYRVDGKGKKPPVIYSGGLSALEHAFTILGWEDPKPCPESSCDIQKCQRWSHAGVPFPDGDYLRLCSEHHAMRNIGDSTLVNRKKKGRGYNSKERKERLARL